MVEQMNTILRIIFRFYKFIDLDNIRCIIIFTQFSLTVNNIGTDKNIKQLQNGRGIAIE